ncbi:unnamed protein product [Ilex paraguariensis]|uniref:Uncharacterized protein n=1 Tax=Ilex paraguariensis TaxID=185542 RepID=A0ABC8T4D1_9AQUA
MGGDQRLNLKLQHGGNEDQNAMEVKQNNKLLSLEWQDQGSSSDSGKGSFGYPNGLGLWTRMMNSYGSSATNPLV